jgi:hypothetical protein
VQLSTNEMKYTIVQSYMQEGKAAQWAGQVTYQIINGMYGNVMPYTWTEFWMQADVIFNPPNMQANAALKLSKLKQGKMSAEEFFIKFGMLVKTAGYEAVHFNENPNGQLAIVEDTCAKPP